MLIWLQQKKNSVLDKSLLPQSSVHWEEDLQHLVAEWFKKNPGWTVSQLANQAIRKFILSFKLRNPRSQVTSTPKSGRVSRAGRMSRMSIKML